MMKLTTEQKRAIAPPYDRNLIVVAGAGSGKTYVLVQRYLALLEAQKPHWSLNDLVAITFTQKAAQEMRDRVRAALTARVRETTGPDQVYWLAQLAEMNAARIDTIHALCGAILRANAPQAGLDPRFRVIDEVERDALIEQAIDRTLFDMMQDETVDPAVTLFTRYETKEVRRVLAYFCRRPLPETPTDPDAILQAWTDRWEQLVGQVMVQAQQADVFRQAVAWAHHASFPPGDTLGDNWQDVYKALREVANYRPSGGGLHPAWQAVELVASVNRSGRGRKANWASDELLQAAREHLKALKEAWAKPLTAMVGEPPGDNMIAAADLLPLWLRLIQRGQARFQALKAQDDLLDFDDLEKRTAALLQAHPEVRVRYVNREYKHILVDEFQDTNADQWAIIQALTDPDTPPSRDPARLFVVGDPKQSIYGFRGGDVRVFESVRAFINDLPTPDGTSSEIPLVTSFRTHQPLVNTFNHIFEQILQPTPGGLVSDYEVAFGRPMEAHRATAPSAAPPLEVMLLDQRPRDPETDAYLPDSSCGSRGGGYLMDEVRAWEGREIARRIRLMVDNGRPVHDPETGQARPMRYGDIGILFRTLADAAIYEAALRDAGIGYVTVGGRGYYSRQEVWDVLALLEALYNPHDHLSLATALRSPLFNLSDEVLFALRAPQPYGETGEVARPGLWAALEAAATTPGQNPLLAPEDQNTLQRAHEILSDLQAIAGRVTIYELLREALARTGYLATLTALPDGTRRRANVEKLLQKAVESNKITLNAFTRYIVDLSDQEVREQEADTYAGDTVTLMTVHKSKGLEFPVVFLPDITRSGRGGNFRQPVLVGPDGMLACQVRDEQGDTQTTAIYNMLEVLHAQRDEAENKRLFYVAATRAADLLIMSGAVCWDEKSEQWKQGDDWLSWLLTALDATAWHGVDDTLNGPANRWSVRLHRPYYDDYLLVSQQGELPLWEQPAPRDGQQLPGPVINPPLLAPVPLEPDEMAYNLTATDIVRLSPHDPENNGQRFRRRLLYDTPERVRQARVPSVLKARVPGRVLGEIVHEALRWGRLPQSRDDMQAELASYAWKYGVVAPHDIDYAVRTANGWLREPRLKRLMGRVAAAQRSYRELPFIYRTDKRVIHGVLDLLFQDENGKWVLVDYKSSRIPGYGEGLKVDESKNRWLLTEHVKRYYLQLGVYAAAVEQQLGPGITSDDIEVIVYYLRYGQQVPVKTANWAAAVSELENQIGKMIEDTDA